MVLAILICAAVPAQAWSDFSNKRFCDDVIKHVWSERDWDRCIGQVTAWDQQRYCNLLEGEQKTICLETTGVLHPAEIPNHLGEGDLEHPGDCLIVKYPERNTLCADKYEAQEAARLWINRSRDASNKCERIYYFCVASNYLAQSFNPFNFVRGEDEECRNIIYRRIDDSLRYNRTTFGFDQSCAFTYQEDEISEPKTFIQTVNINQRHVNEVRENLTLEVQEFYAMPFKKSTEPVEPEPTDVEPIAPVDECEKNSDCTIVQADCCGCTSGGTSKVIAVKDEVAWSQTLGQTCKAVVCPAVIAQHVSCYSKPVCKDGECIFEPDPQKLCGNFDIRSNCEDTSDKTENITYGMSCQQMIDLCGWGVTAPTIAPTTTFKATTIRPTTTIPVTTTLATTTTLAVVNTYSEPEEGVGIMTYALIGIIALAAVVIIMIKRPDMIPKMPKQEEVGLKGGPRDQGLKSKKEGTKLGDAGNE